MRRRTSLRAWVLLLLAFGCGTTQRPVASRRPVKTQSVEFLSAQPRLRYSANIEPREEVSLAFKVSGYVAEVRQMRGADGRMRNLQEGDRVTRGTVLARVRDDDYLQGVNRAQSSLAQAEVSLQKATLDFGRATRLFEAESLTKPDYDAAKAQHDSAVAHREGARAGLTQAEIQLRDTALVAPADGVILSRGIEVGNLVGPGSVAFVLADTSSVKAVFGVPDALMQRARLGVTLPTTTETHGPREFPGKITAIAPAADQSSRVFQVELTIPNPQDLLKPGMIATVEVPEEDPAAARAQAQALVVPLTAIVKPPQGGLFAVYVVEGPAQQQVARLRVVEVGEVYGNLVAVRKGLERGDRVVVTGASLLVDNEAVQVIP